MSGGAEFQDYNCAARLQIHSGGAAVVVAENRGAYAESKARRFPDCLRWDEGVERAVGMQEADTGMGHSDVN